MSELDSALFAENERMSASQDERLYFAAGDLTCLRGGELQEVQVAYQTWGELNAEKSNAILICHALSGDSNAVAWWDRIVGPGLAIDTNKFFVICTNSLGGCRGTTGPNPLGSRFPVITVEDMVEIQCRLLRSLGIKQLHGVAGGSMGGMQALEVTRQFPVEKAWITASTAKHTAMQIGFNEVARQAIKRDPNWRGGDYYDSEPPTQGLCVGRMLGHLTYLSEHSFERKFGRATKPVEEKREQFQVESYLQHQGEKFTHRFDANSLIVLSDAIDLYEYRHEPKADTEYLITSFVSDWIYPSHLSAELAALIGSRAVHHDLPSPLGHDSFLLDDVHQAALVVEFFGRATPFS